MSQDYTILIVDDDYMDRGLIRNAIANTIPEAILMEAETGFEALEKTERNIIAAAIIDFKMPGMDGLELIDELQNRHPNIQLLLCTVYMDTPSRQRAKGKNIHVVSKPLTPEKIHSFLNESIDA